MGYFLQKKRVLERWSFVQVHIITCMSMLLHDIVYNRHLSLFININNTNIILDEGISAYKPRCCNN